MTEPTNESSVVVDGLTFTEGPRWRGDRLWFSDFFSHTVHSVGLAGDDRVEVALDDQPSGLGWLPDGRLLVVSMTRQQLLRVEPDGTIELHADLSALARHWCNDMVVDESGRAYVGFFGFDIEAWMDRGGGETPRAELLVVEPDGAVSVGATDLMFPNGSVLTPGTRGHVLVVAESFGGRLSAFDVAADGGLSGARVWADVSALGASPDGICLDAEGAIWVADALGGDCIRVAEGGTELDRVRFGQNAFACTLGGADGTTLFACTAPDSRAALRSTEAAARIEQTHVSVPGAGSP